MTKKIVLYVLLCVSIAYRAFAEQYLVDADFDSSMTHGDTIILDDMSPKMAKEFDYYKKIYEAKKPSKMPSSATPIIPKIMHQIWDDYNLPPLYEHYFQECKALHPDWEFKIWTNEDIAKFNMQHKDLYAAARSWPAKADIFRYEMLHRYGGVYRDLDVKCIRPLDELLYKYDFFAGLEAYNIPFLAEFTKKQNYNGPYMVVNNGIIGSAPKNKVLSDALQIIEKNFYDQWEKFDNGTLELGEVTPTYMTVFSTMYPLSESFKNNVTIHDKSIILPSGYIFPRMWRSLNRPKGFINRIKSFYYDITNLNDSSYLDIYLPAESLVNHNEEKQDTILPKWNSKRLQKYYTSFKLSPLNKHRFAMVQNVSTDPDKLSFSKISLIPEKVMFVVLDENEMNILKNNLPKWKLFNPAFELDIWDQNRLSTEFTDIFEKAQKHTNSPEDLRFLVGVELLDKKGGHYADFRVTPVQPIFELGNKYQFYGSIAPINEAQPNIEMSTRLLGSVASSPILSGSLEKFYNDKLPITESLLDISTKNNMVYGAILKAKILILPSVAFHPIPYKHGQRSKLWNIMMTNNRDFYGTTVFSVLE